MKKFKKSFRGYNVKEVNTFVSDVIVHVENMIQELDEKEKNILLLKKELEEYKSREDTLNKSIIMAQETSDQMRKMARIEAENIISDAKKNANKIVRDALDRASKVEYESQTIKKNISIFKSRIRNIVEQQLEIIDDIDNIKM